jgi:hypothetical protein
MYTFLVLGLIPGTNIQVSFWVWIILMIGLVLVFRKYRSQLYGRISDWWHQFDENNENSGRKPLHANRLHLRGL